MNRFGKRIVKLVNRYWLFFGVASEPAWGFIGGYFMAYTARNQLWGWHTLVSSCCIVWMTAVFMKAYTEKENRK